MRGAVGNEEWSWWDARWISTAPNGPQCFCQCSQIKSEPTDRKVAGDAGVTSNSGKSWEPFRVTRPGKNAFPCPVPAWLLRLAMRPQAWSPHTAEVAVSAWSRLGKVWWAVTMREVTSSSWMLEHAQRQCHVGAAKQVGWPAFFSQGPTEKKPLLR